MDRGKSSKLSLFLMELIMAIMFFSLAAAVCVRLFAAAHFLAEKTENLSSAVMWTQNISEVFTGKEGNFSEISLLYPEAYVLSDSDENSDLQGQLILFLDKDWGITDASTQSAAYEVYLAVHKRAASDVYSDVTDYGVSYEGDAMVGDIKVINIEGVAGDFESVVTDDSRLIHEGSIDVYIGKEGE